MNDANNLTLINSSGAGLPSIDKLKSEFGREIRTEDVKRGNKFLEMCGYNYTTDMAKEYNSIMGGKKNLPRRREFMAKFMLSTYNIVKLSEVNVFYVEDGVSNLYRMCRSFEMLKSVISLYYQILFGTDNDISKATESMVDAILPFDMYSEIDRTYIQIVDGYYWNRKSADIYTTKDDLLYDRMPEKARCFAKMFDSDIVDKNVFKVPEFDEEDVETMLSVYEKLKDVDYYEWPDEYHFQCFKDWSRDRIGVAYGMFTVLALPYMRILPRGAIFNDGEGHNGKSVLNGLAVSILGSNNVSTIVGDQLGDWDHLVNLQTTWLNIPNETTVDFLKDNSEAFKAMSAQESYTIKKKHGDASLPVICDFPMVFNINKLPDFGQDSGAVLSRMFINKFEVDFEAEGRVVKDYAKKVFLADKTTMPTIVGATLAFAHYYSQDEHIWDESPEMAEAKTLLSETAAPKKNYTKWFQKFFNSFDGITTPKDDFANFGKQEGENYDRGEIKRKDHFFGKFKRSCSGNKTYYKAQDPDNGYFPRFEMCEEIRITKYMGYMSLKEFYEAGYSLVHAMMEDYLIRREVHVKRLKEARLSRTNEEIDKHVMIEMYNDISKEQKGRSYYGPSR